jgi:hypothetical protein
MAIVAVGDAVALTNWPYPDGQANIATQLYYVTAVQATSGAYAGSVFPYSATAQLVQIVPLATLSPDGIQPNVPLADSVPFTVPDDYVTAPPR